MPPTSPRSYVRTTLRWVILRARRISCLKRSSATPSPPSASGRSVLIATGSCSSRSNARYTTPIPPVPSSSFTPERGGGRGLRRRHHVLDQVRFLLEVGHEPAERRRQHADLVGRPHVDLDAVVAILYAPRRERQPTNRAGDLAREHVGGDECEREAEHERDRQGAPQRGERRELPLVRAERHEAAERIAARRADRTRKADHVLAAH